MRVIRGLRNKLAHMEKLFAEENGDLFVTHYDYPLDIHPRWPKAFFWSKKISLHEVLQWLENNGYTKGKVFLYGRYRQDEINQIKTWASQHPNLDLVVTEQTDGGPTEIITLS